MKAAAILLGSAILAMVIAWGGTLFYWHSTLHSALQSFEDRG